MMHSGDWQSLFLVHYPWVTGAILAVFSNNIKRTLACSSCFTARICYHRNWYAMYVGENHNALAVRGTVLAYV